jgi:hypothetical protein
VDVVSVRLPRSDISYDWKTTVVDYDNEESASVEESLIIVGDDSLRRKATRANNKRKANIKEKEKGGHVSPRAGFNADDYAVGEERLVRMRSLGVWELLALAF